MSEILGTILLITWGVGGIVWILVSGYQWMKTDDVEYYFIMIGGFFWPAIISFGMVSFLFQYMINKDNFRENWNADL